MSEPIVLAAAISREFGLSLGMALTEAHRSLGEWRLEPSVHRATLRHLVAALRDRGEAPAVVRVDDLLDQRFVRVPPERRRSGSPEHDDPVAA